MDYLICINGAVALAALLCGITILQRRNDGAGKLMGWCALALFIGEAAHFAAQAPETFAGKAGGLLPVAGRMTAALAVTVICVLLSLLWEKLYGRKNSYYAEMLVRDTAGIRALACVGPVVLRLSGVMQGDTSDPLAGASILEALIIPALRSVMLLVFAAVVAWHWRKTRAEVPALRQVWLWLSLSALFGIAADVGAVFVPALSLLDILQALCLLMIAATFVRFAGESGELR